MMQNLPKDVVTLLEQDNRLVIEGQLFKNKINELALGLDIRRAIKEYLSKVSNPHEPRSSFQSEQKSGNKNNVD